MSAGDVSKQGVKERLEVKDVKSDRHSGSRKRKGGRVSSKTEESAGDRSAFYMSVQTTARCSSRCLTSREGRKDSEVGVTSTQSGIHVAYLRCQ